MTPAQRERYQPRSARVPPGSRDRILGAIPDATWDDDDDADEMNVLFRGYDGREGKMVLIGDDFYVSFDIHTGEPLSIMIPNYAFWLARQLDLIPLPTPSPAPPAALLRPLGDMTELGAQAVRAAIDTSRELAAVG